jgi:predicted lipid-binding transport protein (Tim44 family)
MAIERNPNDPYSAAPTNDESLRRRAEQFDNELQADPELAEGPASGGRIAIFAIALVAILGVVFYGLNSSSTSPDATPTAQTTPASPSDNTAQTPRTPAGQTTGSAMRPTPPAANNPAQTAPQNNAAPAGAPSSN